MRQIKLGATVYHEDVYDGRESLKVVGIREDELELEGDYSGGTHAVTQKSWLPLSGVMFNKLLLKDIQSINGYEIIDFMNTDEVSDILEDYSLSGEYEFVSQKHEDGVYKLDFKSIYNNWSHAQDEFNTIEIRRDLIEVSCGEAHEGDGSEEALEDALKKWIVYHKFDNNPESKFKSALGEASEKIKDISFSSKEKMDYLIDILVKAKTYMK